jgi:hypothetical protein
LQLLRKREWFCIVSSTLPRFCIALHYNALCCVAQVIIPLTFRVTTREMISSRIATVRRRPQTFTQTQRLRESNQSEGDRPNRTDQSKPKRPETTGHSNKL